MMKSEDMIGELKVAPRRQPLKLLILAATMLVLTAMVVGAWAIRQQQADLAADAQWSLQGPPCPASDSQTLRGARPPMAATFDGAKFERRSGFIECLRRPYDLGQGRRDYAVCQFGGPQAVGVTVGGSETFFGQPQGRSLRIAIVEGKPVCVLIERLPMK